MLRIPPDAFWIGSDHPFDLHEAYFNFRKEIELNDAPRAALLHITADSRYRLWINGAHVGRGPARCWPQAQQVDVIDVSTRLRSGRNLIEVQVYSPGYSHFAYVHRGACGLLSWLDVDGHTAAKTGQDWQVSRDLSWRDDVPRISIYGSGVERRDLRRDARNGLAPDLWKVPRIVATANGPIWCGLRPRDVPLLAEEEIELHEPRWSAVAPAQGLPPQPHEMLRAAWQNAKPGPTGAIELKPEQWTLRVFDLGHSRVCSGGVEIKGALGGERVLISYAEKLRDGKLLISDPLTYCRMRPTDEFILRAGTQAVEPFSQRGGRYLTFAFNAAKPVTLDAAFFARLTSYPGIAIKGADGHGKYQKIAAMCARTTLACLQDGFVDSVWRESSQWLGDCVAQGFALAALSKDYRPLRRAIAMAAEGAYADGVLPSVLPGEVHAYTVVDYNFSWIELLHFYCRELKAQDRSGVLRTALPVVKRMLARFKKDEDRSGLLHAQRGRRLFLDWSPMDRGEPNLTYNLRYLLALQMAADLSPAGRDKDDYAARAKKSAAAIAATFGKQGKWQESPGGKPASQVALAFLILTGLLRGQRARDAALRIVARSLDPAPQTAEDKLVLASPFMHHYVFQALHKLGLNTAILDIIALRWGAWADAGEPTCWENWSIDFPDGSACHGFSAHPLGWIKKLVGQK